MKEKIHFTESRSEELANTVPEATRPLLRQIESLQASANERQRIWEELEKNLTERCLEAETKAHEASEKEMRLSSELNTLVKMDNLQKNWI